MGDLKNRRKKTRQHIQALIYFLKNQAEQIISYLQGLF